MVEVVDGDDRPIAQKRDSRVTTRWELATRNKLVVAILSLLPLTLSNITPY